MHYEKSGNGQAIILVHGNGQDLTIFQESVTLLQRSFTVYAIDLPGHGESYQPENLHYASFAQDLYAFIRGLKIEKPIYYGFSDGGIVGILLAFQHPDLLSKLVISGANLDPHGLTGIARLGMKVKYKFTKCKKTKLMLTEPNISSEDLHKITVPTFITVGQFDVIRSAHTKFIAQNIKDSQLHIFKHHLHGSYVVHSDEIAKYMLSIL